jgi:hypothetical protein
MATQSGTAAAERPCRGLLIDATQKGNSARFLNHSCEPNCCTQKWLVGSETRVGIFTQRQCKAGEELTYNYNLEWNGFARIKCAPPPGLNRQMHCTGSPVSAACASLQCDTV